MTDGYQGTLKPESMSGTYNAQSFLISQIINRINTSTLVKVVKCTNAGALSPVGFVNVQPLVDQIDGQDAPNPHAVIYNLPYMRIQGGASAFIIDPEVGDIGIAVFASRDISKVKSTKAQSLPGSGRKYDLADGMYFGGVLNGSPTQFVQFNSSGITITSPNDVVINAAHVNVNASTSATVTTPTANINASSALNVNSAAITLTGPVTIAGATNITGVTSITGATTITGKLNATDTIESAVSLKVAGVTLTVP